MLWALAASGCGGLGAVWTQGRSEAALEDHAPALAEKGQMFPEDVEAIGQLF